MKRKTGGEYPTELAADVIIPSGLTVFTSFYLEIAFMECFLLA